MKLGFIGAGPIARHHAAAALACGAEIAAACTSRRDSPNRPIFADIADVRWSINYRSLIDDPRLDALVVAVPWDFIEQILPDLLACDKPMLIEKPLALSSPKMKDAIRWDYHKNKVVGFNRRFYQCVRTLKAKLRQQSPQYALVTISEHLLHHQETTGAAVLKYLAEFTSIHTLDLVNHLFGPCDVMHASSWEKMGFVSYNAHLLPANNKGEFPIFLRLNANDPTPIGITCLFPDGTSWVLSPLERLTIYKGMEIQPATEQYKSRRFVPKAMRVIDESMNHKPGFKAQMKAFLSGDTSIAAKPEDNLRALEMLDDLAEAANVK